MNSSVFVIGYNRDYELGLEHSDNVGELTEMLDLDKNKHINKIYCGESFSILTNNNNQFWCVGDNRYGQGAIGNSDSPIEQLKLIDFFNKNGIIIKKISNNSMESTLWITDDNKLYVNGFNAAGQLGLGDNEDTNIPQLISDLEYVIDAASTSSFSVALCASNDNTTMMIIQNWLRSDRDCLPQDIINLIVAFCKFNDIYCTEGALENKWNLMNELNNANIIKITGGCYHVLFLSANGSIWGYIASGGGTKQIGIDPSYFNDSIQAKIIQLKYFSQNKIKIKDIASGYYHNLALSYDGKVYSWGYNEDGCCGDGSKNDIIIPKIVEGLTDYNVISIGCGAYHSYCMTSDGKHFLFGSNEYNECLIYNDDYEQTLPYCINETIEEECDEKKIQSVFLGYYNTRIIVSNA